MHINRLVFLPSLFVLFLSLTACIGGTTPSPQFYMLEPISGLERPAGGAQKPVIILTSIRIPHYVDRPQIVTATGQNAYQLSELNRWAEALDHNIRRVLAQNLTTLVPAEVEFSSNPNTTERAKFRVSVNILEFHVDSQEQAGLKAQWQITRNDGMVLNQQESYRVPASTIDYSVMVKALNECLDRLSRDLADELRELAV
ncbi:PqiC family protein [Methylobacter sp. YRD-M1]|uniref:PqiC family protein n=1 Tax=Methylobacter sp. YRD-M1 TaxID=2911520 RepID=UPI00227B1435|nr:PqiC family protein [Methylobacter sp. YRD-M1]WAK00405.1 PqiC family protein [Methylobacter sp. YRD-M1]